MTYHNESVNALLTQDTPTNPNSVIRFLTNIRDVVEPYFTPTLIIYIPFTLIILLFLYAVYILLRQFIIYLKYGPRPCVKSDFVEPTYEGLVRMGDELYAQDLAYAAAEQAMKDEHIDDYFYITKEKNPVYTTLAREFKTVYTPKRLFQLKDSFKNITSKVFGDDVSSIETSSSLESPYSYLEVQEACYHESHKWWILRPKVTERNVRYVYSWDSPIIV